MSTEINLPDEVVENLIIESAYMLMGLGAPIKDDMQGFNKPDWSRMEVLLPTVAVRDEADIPKSVYYHIASTLEKYHRQIDEFTHELIVKYARKHQTNRSYDAVKHDVEYETVYKARKDAEKPKAERIKAVLLAQDTVELQFNYNKEIVDEVRNIPGRRYNAITKTWTFPLENIDVAIELLDRFGADSLRDLWDDNFERVKALKADLPPSAVVAASAADLKKIHVKHVGAVLELRFAKNFAISNIIKTMYGWRWVPDSLCWTVPVTEALPLADALRDAGFDVSEFEPFLPKQAVIEPSEQMDFTKFPGLFEHQKSGINFLLTEDELRGHLLGDDMGLGKTRQAIIATHEWLCRGDRQNWGTDKVLVIVPASLKINWEREIHTVFEFADVYIPGATWNEDEVEYSNWIIINYDMLKKHEDKILARKWAVMIMDEAHYLKNPKALRSKIVTGTSRVKDGEKKYEGIMHQTEKVILLTGTPITSRPIDMFNLLRICGHPLGRNYAAFARRYCEGGRTRFGFQANGASNLSELYRLTRNVILRRLKEDCLDLPEKMRHMIPVEVDLTEYMKHWTEYKAAMEREGKILRAEHLTRMIKLKTSAAISKIPAAIELIDDLIESDQKVILFSNFQVPIDKLKEHYGEQAVVVTGSVTGDDRQKAVDEFQTNPNVKVFLGNIKAAGVGLTLTTATHEIMLDLSWVPSDHLQAEDRAYRIGQKNAVTVHYLNAVGTMDEPLSELNAKKLEIISHAVEGKHIEDNNVFGDLVQLLWGANAISD